eukprot:TRINITY_DN94533_c0_g1_i1.p1 TRINITY_DN94533_c0_g1~~TRINITY_DN94533_c0_g1_i1.p1  ORF type:complete len:804 (+),score=189.49 TRINITY_DN94533_c0_g1_i1:51-2414(+)
MAKRQAAPKDEEDDEEEEVRIDGMPGGWSEEDRKLVLDRVKGAHTGMGLPDLVFNAPVLVQECFDNLFKNMVSLQELVDSVLEAARMLGDNDWRVFLDVLHSRVHLEDQVVHGNLFATAEPSWRGFIQKPKKTRGANMVFLFVGTDPPSIKLADFLCKLGWYGVVVSKDAPAPGNEDAIDHVKLDVADKQDQRAIDGLVAPGGGMLPRPAHFHMAYVNVLYKRGEDEFYIDSDLEDVEEAAHSEDGRRKAAEKHSTEVMPPKFVSSFGQDEPFSPTEEPPLPNQVLGLIDSRGYGKVGVTRGGRVRRMLRALSNSLKVAIHRLADDGTLIICWPGLPVHPVLLWITSNIRRLFARVHVVSPDGAKTFETYILASNFKRVKAEDSTPGVGGLELRSFLHSKYRCDGLDDVINWTVSSYEEGEEAQIGMGGRGVIQGFDRLWSRYAEKYRNLCQDLGIVVALQLPAATPKKGGKKGQKGVAKAKSGPKKQAKEESPVEEDARDGAAPAAPEGGLAEATASSAETPAEVTPEPAATAAASAEPAAPASSAPAKVPDAASAASPPAAPAKASAPTADAAPARKLEASADAAGSAAATASATDGAAAVATAAAPAAAEETAAPEAEDFIAQEEDGKETAKSRKSIKPKAKAGLKAVSKAKAKAKATANARDAKGKKKSGKAGKLGDDKEEEADADAEMFEASQHTKARQALEAMPDPSPRKKVWRLNRAVPHMACSLGAAPGSRYKQGPNYEEMAKTWSLVNAALKVAKAGRIWHLPKKGEHGHVGPKTAWA